MNSADRDFDCVVVGTCCLDLLLRPIPLTTPIGRGATLRTQPVQATTGGLVCNVAVALARLGMNAAALTWVGDDDWGAILRQRLHREGVDVTGLLNHPHLATSTTVGIVDEEQHHSFAFNEGAPEAIDRSFLQRGLDWFSRSRFALIGYYHLLPNLEHDLPDLLPLLHERGCRVAMDTAGGGGELSPLDRILPHVDIYFPNEVEAARQTGRREVVEMISTYRDGGAVGFVGVKRGVQGALISPRPGEFIEVPAVDAPGPVVDTVGAGDSMMAGLLAGLCRGMSAVDSTRMGAAAAACCVTGHGAAEAIRPWDETAALLDLS